MSVWNGWQHDLLASIGAQLTPDNQIIVNAWHMSVDSSGKLNPLGVRAHTPAKLTEAPSPVEDFQTIPKAIAAFKAKVESAPFAAIADELRKGDVDPAHFGNLLAASLAQWDVNLSLYQTQVQALEGTLSTTAGPSRGFSTAWTDMWKVWSKTIPAQRRAVANRASALPRIFK